MMMKYADVPHQRIPASRCPYCFKKLDSVSTVEGDVPPPSKGDLAVCFGCGELMQFGDDGGMEKMTPDEIVDLDVDERAEIFQIQGALRAFLVDPKRRA